MAGRFEFLSYALLFSTVCASGAAAPRLTVSAVRVNGEGNVEWVVKAAPDPALFSETGEGLGGSLDIELGVEVTTGSLVQAFHHSGWHSIPGFNPFTGSASVGTQADAAQGTVFTSLGSDFLTSGDPVDVLTIETVVAPTTISWGGHTHWPGLPYEFVGGRITQAGLSFDTMRGSLAWTPGGPGDFNASGLVEQADLDLVLRGWGASADPPPDGWVADLPSGFVDQRELDQLLLNWGRSAPSAIGGSYAVPEPSAAFLLAAGAAAAIALLACRRAAVHA